MLPLILGAAAHAATTTTVGDLTIAHAGDVADLEAICASGPVIVDGDLVIEGSRLTDFDDGDCIVEVDGDVEITSSSLVTLRLGALETSGTVDIDNDATSLRTVDFPALTAIDGDLFWDAEGAVVLGGFDALEYIHNRLVISTVSLRRITTFGALSSVDDLWITSPRLQGRILPQVREVPGHVDLLATRGLIGLSLPALRSVGRDLSLYLDELDGGPIRTVPTILYVETLEISGSAAVTDLGGLESLRVIGDELRLYDNPALVSLDGLDLTVPPTNLRFDNNQSLADISALFGLPETLTDSSGLGPVRIVDCPALASLAGLEGVQTIEGDLRLDNVGLVDLSGLEDLQTVTQDLVVNSMARLESLEGLDSLLSTGPLDIHDNDLLVDLRGLESLDTIVDYDSGTGLSVVGNASLESLEGLEGLTTVERGIELSDNPLLASIEGLGSVSSVERVGLEDLPSLSSLAGLEGITELDGFFLQGEHGVSSLDPLSGLVTVYDDLWLDGISDVSELSSLDRVGTLVLPEVTELSWETLTRMGSDHDLPSIETISLPALTSLGALHISGSSGLSAISLPVLETVTGDLILKYNANLATLELPALESVGPYLTLSGGTPETLSLPSLTTVRGNLNLRELTDATAIELDSLTLIEGHLDLSDNTVLSSFEAPALETIEDDLDIVDNPALSQSEMESWAAGVDVGGSTTIEGNLED